MGSADGRRGAGARDGQRSTIEPVTHPLIGIARDLQADMVARLRDEHGHAGLRPSLGPLLSLVWLEASPASVLARRLGVSRQAVSQLVRLAATAGHVEQAPIRETPSRQAVRLSATGRSLVTDAMRIMRAREAEYARRIGGARFALFATACQALYRALEVHPRVDSRRPGSGAPRIGGLPQLALEIERRLLAATAARGHEGLKLSHAHVLPRIGPEGTRVRDLSLRHRVSRQVVSLTCRELQALGYLRREPDPEDRRGALLRLTARGERLLADSIEASRALEREFVRVLGADDFEAFRAAAHALFGPLRERSDRSFATLPVHPRPRALGAFEQPARSAGEEDGLEALALDLRARLGDEGAARLAARLLADSRSPTGARGARRARRRPQR